MKKGSSALLLLFLFLLLSGCWKNRTPALFPLSPCHKESAKPPKSVCTPPPCLPNGVSFNLAQLVDIGLANNPATKESWALAKEAVASLGIAESSYYPTVALQAYLTRQRVGSPFNVGPFALTSQNIGITIAYLLLDFGGRQAGVEAAEAALVAADWSYSWQIQTVLVTIVQSYYGLISAEELLQASLQNLKDAEVNLESAKAQWSAGINMIVDVLQAEAIYYETKLQVVQQEANVQTAQATLANALGVRADTLFDVVVPDLSQIQRVKIETCALIKEAKCCRADLRALQARAASQRALIEQQKSAFYPTLSFVGNYGTTYFKNFGSDQVDYNFYLLFNMPIFNGYQDINNYLLAKAEYEESIAALEFQENMAFLAVLTNYYALQAAIESVEASTMYKRYAEEAYEATLAGYQAGVQTMVALTQSFTTMVDARSAFIQSQTNYFLSLANLAYSLGALTHA